MQPKEFVSVETGQQAQTFIDGYNHALKQGRITQDESYCTEMRDGVGGIFKLCIGPSKGRSGVNPTVLKVWVKLDRPDYGGDPKKIVRYKYEKDDTNCLRRRIELCILDARAEARRVKYAEWVFREFSVRATKIPATEPFAVNYGTMTVDEACGYLKNHFGVAEPAELLDENEPMTQERNVGVLVSESSFEQYKKTGRAPIPVPREDELDAIRVEVEIAARDDMGQVRPTPQYFMLNPLEDEIQTFMQGQDEHKAFVGLIADAVIAKQEVKEATQLVRTAIIQGQVWNWDEMREQVEGLLENNFLRAIAQDVISILEAEQGNMFGGLDGDVYPEAHIVNFKQDMVDPWPAICGDLAFGKFVALDLYKQLGAPSFTPICPNCAKIAEGLPDVEKVMTPEEMVEATIVPNPRDTALEAWLKSRYTTKMGRDPDFFKVHYHTQILNPRKIDTYAIALYDYALGSDSDGHNTGKVMYVVVNVSDKWTVFAHGDFPIQWKGQRTDGCVGARVARKCLGESYGYISYITNESLNEWRETLLWTDQYDDPVPRDLVAIPEGMTPINDEFHTRVWETPWYEIKGMLFVSNDAVYDPDEPPDDTTPKDYGIDLEREKIIRVEDKLKRYNEADGYYHA